MFIYTELEIRALQGIVSINLIAKDKKNTVKKKKKIEILITQHRMAQLD